MKAITLISILGSLSMAFAVPIHNGMVVLSLNLLVCDFEAD